MKSSSLPSARGVLEKAVPMKNLTWLRVGGPAEWLFQPEDQEDLAQFLAALPESIAVFPFGVGSNLIVRDGGISGVVIRLGRAFRGISISDGIIEAGAAVLDSHLARAAAKEGMDLTFLRTIPGSIGGAVRMNAGCYGSYVADHLISADVLHRNGSWSRLSRDELDFKYRSSALAQDDIVISAKFMAKKAPPDALIQKMEEQLAKRDATQPTRDRTAGSTFRNPAGHSSIGRGIEDHSLKAWSLIDQAGLRGAQLGGATMNEKHPNFLTNSGDATAHELESLGESVRERVFKQTGIRLEWEIMRVGNEVDPQG